MKSAEIIVLLCALLLLSVSQIPAQQPVFKETIIIENTKYLQNTLKVLPNPVETSAKVMINIPKEGELLIEVCDLNGAVQSTMKVNESVAGVHGYDLSIEKLHSGVYFVRLTYSADGNFIRAMERFVKL